MIFLNLVEMNLNVINVCQLEVFTGQGLKCLNNSNCV